MYMCNFYYSKTSKKIYIYNTMGNGNYCYALKKDFLIGACLIAISKLLLIDSSANVYVCMQETAVIS